MVAMPKNAARAISSQSSQIYLRFLLEPGLWRDERLSELVISSIRTNLECFQFQRYYSEGEKVILHHKLKNPAFKSSVVGAAIVDILNLHETVCYFSAAAHKIQYSRYITH